MNARRICHALAIAALALGTHLAAGGMGFSSTWSPSLTMRAPHAPSLLVSSAKAVAAK